MKANKYYKILITVIFVISICNRQEKKVKFLNHDKFSYSGFIYKNPVELNFTILEDNTVMGEMKYLNQKKPVPIKLIGNFNSEAEYT